MFSVVEDADAAVETRILDGINSGSWYHCLQI